MTNRNIPVLVGVGEAKNASRRCEDAVEPLDLMLQAIQAAAQDATPSTNTEFLRDIDTLHVVASSTWIYNDLPGLLSQRLGIKPVRKAYSRRAGNSSVEMIDDAAQLIGSGESEIALIVGGEAFASCKYRYLCV